LDLPAGGLGVYRTCGAAQNDVAPRCVGPKGSLDHSRNYFTAAGLKRCVTPDASHMYATACGVGLNTLADVSEVDSPTGCFHAHRPAQVTCVNVSARCDGAQLTFQLAYVYAPALGFEVKVELRRHLEIEGHAQRSPLPPFRRKLSGKVGAAVLGAACYEFVVAEGVSRF
jgi:hypothetical protein